MEPAPPDASSRIVELERRLGAIERRLARLEAGADRGEVRDSVGAERNEIAPEPTAAPTHATETLPLLGRAILVLGGAFVLRAATEAQVIAPATGAALGIVYALAWLVVADWMAGAERRRRATFYGLAAVAIALPLLWEITVKFRFIGPTGSAAAVTGIAVVALGVAWRRRLHGLAWASALAGAGAALALSFATREPMPFTVSVLLLGLATLWLGWSREWPGLAWTVSAPAILSVFLLTLIASLADPERAADMFRPGPVIALHIGLVAVYVGSLTARTLRTGSEVRPAEITVSVAAAAVGLGGAVAVAGATGTAGTAVGLVALALGATSYGASFTFIDRTARRTNFIFYTTLALGFLLVGVHVLFRGIPLAMGLGVAALVTAGVGAWRERATLSLHGAVYAAAAFVASGLTGDALAAVSARVLPGREWIDLTELLVLGVTGACCALPVAAHGRTWGRLSELPKLVLLLLAAIGAGGVLISLLGIWLPRGADGAADPASAAVLRTGVLAAAAIGLAALGRVPRVAQAAWLVYPVLLAAGVKLVLEDVRVGRPGTLVLSLALLGGALILAPRLLRRPTREE